MKLLIIIVPLIVVLIIGGCYSDGTKDGYEEIITNIETVTNPFFMRTETTEKITEIVVEITTLIEKTQNHSKVERTTQKENPTISAKIADIVGIINNYRISKGLKSLKISEFLCDIAEIRAEEATVNWSHTRPNGQGIDSLLTDSNVIWSIVGENLAKYEKALAEDVVKAWLSSDSHRKNLLNPRYKFCGIAEHKYNGICYISIVLTD